jgi:type VI secretion system secreted protein Hcp
MDETRKRKGKARLVVIGALAALSAAAAPDATAAADIFLKLEGIKGESKDAKHGGEIDVLSWSWGFQRPSGATLGRPGTQPVCSHEMSITKTTDLASGPIIAAAATGRTLDAKLTVARSGAAPFEYLVVTMSGVTITSLQSSTLSGSSVDGTLEIVSLAFRSATLEYKSQDPQTGEAGPSNTAALPSPCP